MYIQYLRGYEGKPKSKFAGKGTLLEKEYNKGKSDRDKGLPNRYIKSNK